MNRSKSVHTFVLAAGAIAVAVCCTAGAQTTTTVPTKKVVPPHATAKTATPKTVSQKTQTPTPTPASVVTPASSQTVIPNSTAVSTAVPATTVNGLTSTGSTVVPSNTVNGLASGSTVAPTNMVNGLTSTGTNAVSNTVNGLSSAGTNAVSGMSSAGTNAVNGMVAPGSTTASGQNSVNGAAVGDPRSPVGGMGVGSFVYAGWNLTAYGCFRTGTRLFCDFDTAYQSNLQAGSNIWGPVKLVDDGGKITDRHNAFFVGDDGSQFQTAYLTPSKPTRFIIEFDNIDQRYTSVSLVLGKEQIQPVPITIMDPNTPSGTMPARAGAGTRGVTR
jgi:hypothetical protein